MLRSSCREIWQWNTGPFCEARRRRSATIEARNNWIWERERWPSSLLTFYNVFNTVIPYVFFNVLAWKHIRHVFFVYASSFLKMCSVLFPLDSAGEDDDWSNIFTVDWWLRVLFLVDRVEGAQVLPPLGVQFPSNQIFQWRKSLIVESLTVWLGWIFWNMNSKNSINIFIFIGKMVGSTPLGWYP